MLSSLQSSSTMGDERALRAYLCNDTWNMDESAPGPPMDNFNLSSSGNTDKFLNSSVNFPAEMRSANLNDMVSSIIDENSEYYQPNGYLMSNMMNPSSWSNAGITVDHSMHQYPIMKNIPPRQMKLNSASLAESGQPRNIPDSCSTCPNPPRDLQVLVRKGDQQHGINVLVMNVSLQQFRQMIGLQSSATNNNDRRITSSQRSTDNRRAGGFPSIVNGTLSSSSSSSSSSLPNSNVRLMNGYKPTENKKWSQDSMTNYSSMPNSERQHLAISPHESISMNFPSTNGATTSINEANINSPITTCQDIRRTGVANTLHISIEKCYEQLNYIRESYTETESKIGIQNLHKCPSPSTVLDGVNNNVSTLSNNPSRVDRLIAEYHHEYNRMIRLHERVRENLTLQDTESTRQTLDEWLSAINKVQDRRRQEIDNAAEKCRSGEPRLPDEKDVLQLAEALRVLRITTRKIRTVLWYWLYWSTNVTSNRLPLVARHQDDQICADSHSLFYSNLVDESSSKQNDTTSTVSLLYSSSVTNYDDSMNVEFDENGQILSKKKSVMSNENNKENECNQ